MRLTHIFAGIIFLITTALSANAALAVTPVEGPTPLSCQGNIVWQNPDIGTITSGIGAGTRLINGRVNTLDTNATLPAGTYSAVVRAWDGYDTRSTVTQTNEQYRIVLTDASNSVVYTSSYTTDVPDPTNANSAQNDTNIAEFTTTSDTTLSFEHIGGNGPGSVLPTSVCFSEVVDVCTHNNTLAADDKNCKPTCEHNNELFADDANCRPVCEHNDQLLQGDANCKPECKHDEAIFADSPNCRPACEYDSSLFANDEACIEPKEPEAPTITVVQPQVTKLPRTGAGSVAFLGLAISTGFGAAHAAIRRKL